MSRAISTTQHATEFKFPYTEEGTYESLGHIPRRYESFAIGTRRVVNLTPDKQLPFPETTIWELSEYTIGKHKFHRWSCPTISHRVSLSECWASGPYVSSFSRVTYQTFERAVRACIIRHREDLQKAVELLAKYAPEKLK